MPYGEQKSKWFSWLLFISLPFYLIYRLIKNDLPDLKDVGPPGRKIF